MGKKSLIPKVLPARIRQLLSYDKETGELRWLVSRGSRSAGSLAGCPDSGGYLQVRIDGRAYMAHCVAFVLVEGRWPEMEIDHWDMVRSNNRWANLRHATSSQNRANLSPYSSNKSGCKGVSWYRRTSKWVVKIGIDGKKIHLGYRDSFDEARRLYVTKAVEHYGEFARV